MTLLANPTRAEFKAAIAAGERNTWPLLRRVRMDADLRLSAAVVWTGRSSMQIRVLLHDDVAADAGGGAFSGAAFCTSSATPSWYSARWGRQHLPDCDWSGCQQGFVPGGHLHWGYTCPSRGRLLAC